MTERIIAVSEFDIEASQERLWHIIGGVILNSLSGLERMEILDDNNWQALLRIKLGFVVLNMNLKGEMVDMSPPDSLGVRLNAKSKWGILHMNQKVAIAFTTIDKDKTEVAGKAVSEDMGIILRLFTMWRAKSFAASIFNNIEDRLKYLTVEVV